MAKAVLVMDMPENCENCACKYFSYEDDALYDCAITGKTIPINGGRYGEKPDWCPLRELSEKKGGDKWQDEISDSYNAGWNACIEEIIKEISKQGDNR